MTEIAHQTIWKKPLLELPLQEVNIPEGADILCAHSQYEEMCIWFRCDPNTKLTPRTIAIVGTGHAAPNSKYSRYLGTCFLRAGSYALHIFEKTE